MKVYYDPENKNLILSKKLSVVELYLSSEMSYQDVALQEGIRNPSQIVKGKVGTVAPNRFEGRFIQIKAGLSDESILSSP